ncbi:MAG: S8 family serine peptidase [Desulfobacterales bacterium]|jgi:subtilisin family serine protease
MNEKRRVMIQMRYVPELAESMAARALSATTVSSFDLPGCLLDSSFTPAKIPMRQPRSRVRATEVGRLFTFDTTDEASTYILRAEVEDEDGFKRLIEHVDQDPNGVGVFSDVKITELAVCPPNAVGDVDSVKEQLQVSKLHTRGMDGTGVLVAVVDTGINLQYLQSQGLNPGFDSQRSWSPNPNDIPGSLPVGHGTMCAFDAAISAPNCTLIDIAILRSQTPGETAMDGFLTDAVKAYSKLLETFSDPASEDQRLVVNNSWAMFHPSWDFEIDHPGNYSDNPDHPFNVITESLVDAGADVLFAAGNCGAECPDGRCEGVTDSTIYGANSHPSILCVGAVTVNNVRLGYSSQGPGRLEWNKPDICAYSHFEGSGVYSRDGGTSAACPVAAGVVAAIRTHYSNRTISPEQLNNIIRRHAKDLGEASFDYNYGHGLIDPEAILNYLDGVQVRKLPIGELASGSLVETGDAVHFKTSVGTTLNITLDGPQGVDFDIYVRKDEAPTINDYDYRGYTNSATEKIMIHPLEPGEYYVMVRSYQGTGDFTIKAELD